MPTVKPDNVHASSLFGTYINYLKTTKRLTISGSIPTGPVTVFSLNFPYTRAKSRADFYIQRVDNGKKGLSAAGRLAEELFPGYPTTGNSSVESDVVFDPTSATFNIRFANNTGAPIPVATTDFDVTMIAYDAPIS